MSGIEPVAGAIPESDSVAPASSDHQDQLEHQQPAQDEMPFAIVQGRAFTELPKDWDEMRTMIDDVLAQLDAITPEYLESIADETIGFELGGNRLMELTGQNMLLSLNQPNFFFHATTFYDILRMKGVALGKRDFLGTPRILGA